MDRWNWLSYYIQMGCLCPRKLECQPATSFLAQVEIKTQQPTLEDLVVDSERNKIFTPSPRKDNLSKLEMFSQLDNPFPPDKPGGDKTEIMDSKTGFGRMGKSGVLVSQLGGSKLERTISILSTEGDILSLNDSSSSSTQPLNQEMVVVSNSFQPRQKLRKIKKRYYSLIESKLYVKKDPRIITRIKSPSESLSLFCNLQTIRQTIHLTDGIPIENIKILTSEPLAYHIQEVYPLTISITLQCISCGAKKLRNSSSCKLQLNFVCNCGSTEFKLVELMTTPDSVPLWHQGRKTSSSVLKYKHGGEIRAIGCNVCWRLESCKPMPCGCLRCDVCKFEHIDDKCVLCL